MFPIPCSSLDFLRGDIFCKEERTWHALLAMTPVTSSVFALPKVY